MLILLVMGAWAVVGCAESDSDNKGTDTPVTAQAAPEPGAISRSDGPKGEWPLTVSEGVVRCEGSAGSGSVIFRASDGTDYAVNGTAKTLKPDLPEIDAIWKKPDKYGLRINISPVIDKGLALCG